MQYLRQSTATTVPIGPFVDKTDGVTLEEAITVANLTVSLFKHTDALPADTITNGAFSSDTGWTKGTNWQIAGVANQSAPAASDIEQTPTTALVENQAYEVVYTVASRTAGAIVVKIGGTSGTSRNTNATFTETIIAGSGSLIEFSADGTWDGNIDNVTMELTHQEITPAASGSPNDMVFADGGTYDFELSVANTGILGRFKLVFEDVSDLLPRTHEYMIVTANWYDSMFGSDKVDVSVVEWLGTAPAVLADTDKLQVSLQHGATGVINNTLIAADAIGASELAADAVTEIRDAVTGGGYALDTDANGRLRIVDGTGIGELDTLSGTVLLRAATETQIDNIETDTAQIGTAGAGLTAINLPNQTMDITGTITTVTNLTNLPSIPTNWLTAAGIAASAFDDVLEDAGLVLQITTIATLASQTSFTLTAGSADDDAYNGCIIVVEDVSTAAQKAIGLIDDYTGSTKTVTLQADPGIFTIATTDKVRIVPLAVLEIVKATWDRKLTGALHNIAASAGKILRQLSTAFVLHTGTAQAGAAASITLDTGASALDDFYHHARVVIQAGTGLEQQALIVHYNGTTKVAKISPPWATIPDSTSEFAVEPALSHADTGWATIEVGTVVAATSTTVTLDSAEASAVDDFYNDDLIKIHAGTGDGQLRVITDYVGSTKVATVHAAWLTIPDTTSEYIVEDGHPYQPLILVDTNELQTDDIPTLIAALPTQAEITGGGYALDTDAFGRQRIVDGVGAGELDTLNGTVQLLAATQASIDAIETDTTTDIPALIATAQADLDTITGSDGVTLATAQANYAPATAAALVTTDAVCDSVLALLDDARGEPGQGAPPVNPDMATKVDYLYKAWRNKKTQSATELLIYADDTTTIDHKATISEVASVFTQTEFVTGA